MEIATGIYLLRLPIPDNPLGFVNCYLIQGKGGWLMVDIGWHAQETLHVLEAGLQELGLDLTDIATIIVTHVHPDHFGLAGRIKQVSPNTRLLAHRWEWDFIEPRYIKFADLANKMGAMLNQHGVPSPDLLALESASMPALQFVTVTLPDEPLYGGEVISTGIYELETIWTPGHSPGHICLYEPQNRLLFTGDHILPTITTNISYHIQSGENPLGDYIHSLRKLENLEVSMVLPGHEDPFNDLPERINQIVAHHEQRKREVCQVLKTGPRVAYEISTLITWNLPGITWNQFPPLQKRIALTETVAHLECLRWEGRVRRIIENGLVMYSLR
jgi:glyoxylase-like metal-dependent hydrolase (beta-lactamase superfamily II)